MIVSNALAYRKSFVALALKIAIESLFCCSRRVFENQLKSLISSINVLPIFGVRAVWRTGMAQIRNFSLPGRVL